MLAFVVNSYATNVCIYSYTQVLRITREWKQQAFFDEWIKRMIRVGTLKSLPGNVLRVYKMLAWLLAY